MRMSQLVPKGGGLFSFHQTLMCEVRVTYSETIYDSSVFSRKGIFQR